MQPVVLFEDEGFVDLLPLTFWRTVFELRVGRQILLDRIAQRLATTIAGVWTRDWIAPVAAQRCSAPANQPLRDGAILVNGRWLVDDGVQLPASPCVGMVEDTVVFVVSGPRHRERLRPRDFLDPHRRDEALSGLERITAPGRIVRYPWQIVAGLGDLLRRDLAESKAFIEPELDPRTSLQCPERIQIGQGTHVHSTAVIDADPGPVHISHDVRIGAHAVIQGPAYLGAGTHLNPHAWLHGGNAIGPICKIGGEVDGCVIDGYTNKQHAGFLGHSYVGSWVNLGAGSTNSDLKNTYGPVRVPVNGTEVDSRTQFFGAVIGDFAKVGINATMPTGAVVGFAASIAASRLLPKWIPSFSWVTEDRVSPGDPSRLLDAATAMMVRRNIDMTDDEVELFLELGRLAPTFERRA
jgi:UDP-N-acetylglucosamine diphosphorylase/glucosamine-1-phosphate N-acetyltransferase